MRDYQTIAAALTSAGTEAERMQQVVDLLWEHLSAEGVSWVGFYLHEGGDELVLGPLRDKPACSPISLQGVCGQAFLSRQAHVVDDVQSLGENYIACDPRDRSEVVVPLLRPDRTCFAVLDVDSFDVGAFSAADVAGLARVLEAAGFTPVADIAV